MGEVEPEDIVVFQSKANDVMPNSFGYMNNFRVVTKPPKHSYIELPENPNTFWDILCGFTLMKIVSLNWF